MGFRCTTPQYTICRLCCVSTAPGDNVFYIPFVETIRPKPFDVYSFLSWRMKHTRLHPHCSYPAQPSGTPGNADGSIVNPCDTQALPVTANVSLFCFRPSASHSQPVTQRLGLRGTSASMHRLKHTAGRRVPMGPSPPQHALQFTGNALWLWRVSIKSVPWI